MKQINASVVRSWMLLQKLVILVIAATAVTVAIVSVAIIKDDNKETKKVVPTGYDWDLTRIFESDDAFYAEISYCRG